jgi:hypothetical protein
MEVIELVNINSSRLFKVVQSGCSSYAASGPQYFNLRISFFSPRRRQGAEGISSFAASQLQLFRLRSRILRGLLYNNPTASRLHSPSRSLAPSHPRTLAPSHPRFITAAVFQSKDQNIGGSLFL